MRFKSIILMLAAAGLTCMNIFGLERKENDPVVDFVFNASKKADLFNNMTLTAGKNVKYIKGPTFGQALEFDGTKGSITKFKLSDKAAKRLSGSGFTISFWARVDQSAKGGDTGLGLKINPDMTWAFGFDNGFTVTGRTPLAAGVWHHFQYQISAEQNAGEFYLDDMLYASAAPGAKITESNFSGFAKAGNFTGGIAELRIWDRMVKPQENLMIVPDAAPLKDIAARLAKLKKLPPALEKMRAELQEDLNLYSRKRQITVIEDKQLTNRITTFFRLNDSAAKISSYSLSKAPFIMLEVPPCSAFKHSPDCLDIDAQVTDTLRIAAAKNEFEPVSFLLFSAENLKNIEIIPGDFTGDNGAKLPASIVDMKVVKFLYQPGFDSYQDRGWCYSPALLLNDDAMFSVDHAKQINLQNKKNDAAKLQPVNLEKGKTQQFWLTAHVPETAKAGLYTANYEIKADGKDAGTFTVQLRVFPFALTDCKTSYDLNNDFVFYLGNGVDLAKCIRIAKDEGKGEALFRNVLQAQKDHGFTTGDGAWASDGGVDAKTFRKDMEIRQKMGMPMQNMMFYAAEKDASAVQPRDSLLPGKGLVFSATDDFNDPFIFDAQSVFINKLKAGKVKQNTLRRSYFVAPDGIYYHMMPNTSSIPEAEDLHLLGDKLICYPGPYDKTANPHTMRYRYGVCNYLLSADGSQCLNYEKDLPEKAGTTLTDAQVFVITEDGSIILTPAFEACREAIDDVKYVTLLRQISEECFAVKDNLSARRAAARAMSWYAQNLPNAESDLDLFRLEVAEHIVFLMKKLGKDVKN